MHNLLIYFDLSKFFGYPTDLDLTNPLTWGVPAFVALIIIEIIVSLKYEKELYVWKDTAASATMGAGATILAVFTKSLAIFMFYQVYWLFNPMIGDIRVNLLGYTSFYHQVGFAWWLFLICQVLDDFNYYWYHRLSHTIRVLWAAHIVHHSSDNFNLGTGIRNGWVTLFYKPLFWLWLPAIGFHPVMVATCLGIQSLWQFQLHSKLVPKLGFLERFMNLHTQHQVHHAQNLEYLDKNHGGYLNLFDKIFGSHQELLEETVETKYGVIHPPKSNNPIEILTHEYADIWKDVKSTKNWKHKFMYVFGPPGWSPDGSTLTVRQVQRILKEKNITAKEFMELQGNRNFL